MGGPMFANDFLDIPEALRNNRPLRDAITALINREPMPAKITEGGDRVARFRVILVDLTNGHEGLDGAFARTEIEIPREDSNHSGNNRVFPAGWAERHVRTQFSRFYNQAVLEYIIGRGETTCIVPHSAAEDATSDCSRYLAGRQHDPNTLYKLLIEAYTHGIWNRTAKIPHHPHCTHVVMPKT